MMPLVDRPFVAHQIDLLTRHGVTDIIFSCGYRPDALEDHFGDGRDFGVRLRYVVDPSPLGTAGAVANAGDLLDGGEVLVLNGDILTDLDLGAVIAAHHERGGDGTIVLTPVEDPSAYGLVRLDATRAVSAFLEKPTPDQLIDGEPYLINAGTYVLSAAAVASIPHGVACSIEREIFPTLAAEGRLYGYPSDAYWRDIGTHRSYLDAHLDVLEGRARTDTRVDGGHWRAADANVAHGAQVMGASTLGAGAQVADGARVEASVLGDGAVVERDAVVRDAVLGAGCRVGAGATVCDLMVVGDGATIAEGATLTGPGAVPTGAHVAADGTITTPDEGRP